MAGVSAQRGVARYQGPGGLGQAVVCLDVGTADRKCVSETVIWRGVGVFGGSVTRRFEPGFYDTRRCVFAFNSIIRRHANGRRIFGLAILTGVFVGAT